MKGNEAIKEENMNLDFYGVDSVSYQISLESLNKILNGSLASLQIDSITAINEAGDHIHFDPWIHLIIGGQPGSFKSTMMKQMIKKVGGINISSVTTANLLGAVDKEGNFTEPLFWQARDGILGIDDWSPNFHNGNDNKYFDALLKFLEDYFVTKKFTWKTKDFELKDKKNKFNSMIMKENIMDMKCKTLFIANTMRNFILKKEKMVSFEALLSRCFYFPFNPSRQSVRDYMDGKINFFKYKKIKLNKDITISKKDYKIIQDYIFDKEMSLADTTRGVGLLVRFFAVYGFHDYDLYDEIIRIKRLRG